MSWLPAAASFSDVEHGVPATTAPRITRRGLVLGGGGIAATLAAAVAVRGLPGHRGSGPTVAKVDPPPATEFRYDDIRSASPYLVDVTNMKVYREEWWVKMGMPELTYWGPEQNDVEGTLLYRFPFGRRMPQVALSATCACHIFGEGQGGEGRGAAALEVSADGLAWTTLADGIEPRQWGVYVGFDDSLPSHLLGHAELWLRVRCLTQGCPNDSYSTAQFGRAGIHQEPVFSLTADEPRRV